MRHPFTTFIIILITAALLVSCSGAAPADETQKPICKAMAKVVKSAKSVYQIGPETGASDAQAGLTKLDDAIAKLESIAANEEDANITELMAAYQAYKDSATELPGDGQVGAELAEKMRTADEALSQAAEALNAKLCP